MAPEYPQDSVQYNIAHDENKNKSISVYMNEALYNALLNYRFRTGQSLSDACGKLLKEAISKRPEGWNL